MQIPLSDIEIRNLDEDMELEYRMDAAYVEISAIYLSNDEKRMIQSTDFIPYIDCQNLKEGDHELVVKFEESPNNIQILSDVTIKVRIKIKEEEKISVTKKPMASSTPKPIEQTPEPDSEPEEEPEESTEPVVQ